MLVEPLRFWRSRVWTQPRCGETYLDVVEVDLREGGVVALYPLQGLFNVGGVRGFVEHGAHLLPFDHIWDRRTDDDTVTLGRKSLKKRTASLSSLIQLTVVTVFTCSSRVRLTAGDQGVHAQDGCGDTRRFIQNFR